MHFVHFVDREAKHFHLLFDLFFGVGLEHRDEETRRDVGVDVPERRDLGAEHMRRVLLELVAL